jgi:hypothetical protein
MLGRFLALSTTSALVVGLMMATPAPAATVASIAPADLSSGNWAGGTTFSLTGGSTYELILSFAGITGNYAAANITAYVYEGANFIANVSQIGSTNGAGAAPGTTFVAPGSGTYSLWIYAAQLASGGPFSSSTAYVVKNAAASVSTVGVPGPEAGAGALSLLGGIGAAVWAARRRKDGVAA